ncbi:MAG: hypothetical protein GC181_10780 [Bacteroidetes bacterium]|nr:hypothetical protein [Bacteroidota bacterium]
MRFVIKADNERTPRLASDETYRALLTIIQTVNKNLITDAIYREGYDTPDGKRSRVEDQLAISYKNKCAYCERLCKADIEHYRPKKGVAEDKDHEGYYWLCYEWTNLIPSCITCNREGAKHNQFPILGVRVNAPTMLPDGNLDVTQCRANNAPLLNEIPFLLHPEVDRPEDYFDFKIDPRGEGIRILGNDVNGRGNQTIQICLLNRKEIKLDRVERVIDDFKVAIQSLFIQLESGALSEDQLVEKTIHHLQLLKEYSLSEDKTHTYLRKYIVRSSANFEKIVLPFLDMKVRKIILEAFKSIEPL